MTPDKTEHVHVVRLDGRPGTYELCSTCGEALPFVFDESWTTEQLVRAAHESGVGIDFDFIPQEEEQHGRAPEVTRRRMYLLR